MKGEGDRFDLFAAMPPLEAKRLLFRMAVVSKGMDDYDGEQLKLLFVDVKKAHLNGKLPEEAGWGSCQTEEMVVWHEASGERLGKRLRREAGGGWVHTWCCCTYGFLQPGDEGEAGGPWG